MAKIISMEVAMDDFITRGFGILVLAPEILAILTVVSMMVIAVIVLTKLRKMPAPLTVI